MTLPARSTGWFVNRLMHGPLSPAIGVGHGHLKVGSYVVTFTEPGSPRMPNGIECAVTVREGEEATIGGGALRIADARVLAGPVWNAKPTVNVVLEASPHQDPDITALLGSGPGLTPAGDDVLVGYIAGRVLFDGDTRIGGDIHARAVGYTTSLSVTLLFHAALGELPEPAHDLLEACDVDPLLSFGHSSGRAILLGLALGHPRTRHPTEHPSRVIPMEAIGDLANTIVRVFPAAPSVEAPHWTSSTVSSNARRPA